MPTPAANWLRVDDGAELKPSAHFHSIQTARSARRVTAEWVGLADEIDAQISKVLAMLG